MARRYELLVCHMAMAWQFCILINIVIKGIFTVGGNIVFLSSMKSRPAEILKTKVINDCID